MSLEWPQSPPILPLLCSKFWVLAHKRASTPGLVESCRCRGEGSFPWRYPTGVEGTRIAGKLSDTL